MRQPGGQCVYVAIGAVQASELGGKPVVRDPSLGLHQEQIDPGQKGCVLAGHRFAEIGKLHHFPELPDGVRAGCRVANLMVAAHAGQRLKVVGDRAARQPMLAGRDFEAADQRIHGGEIEIGIAPLEDLVGIELVIFDPLDHVIGQRNGVRGDPESAVIHIAPGATGDLRQFRDPERAMLASVEFRGGGEGHMVHIHVEAHADGVRGDEEVDIARLVESDLGVAGARAQRAHHHGRAAALTADEFGDGVNLVGGERDDGAAAGQARQFLRAGPGKFRKAGPVDEPGARQEPADQVPRRIRAHQHGLVAAPAAQQPVGEGVAALTIRGELDFVDGDEVHFPVLRHRFDRADEIARGRRRDLFLAGDKSDFARPLGPYDPVIDFARKQAQRQADHARLMAEHAFDGEMGLAGVGGAENRRDRPAGRDGGPFVLVCGGGGRATHDAVGTISQNGVCASLFDPAAPAMPGAASVTECHVKNCGVNFRNIARTNHVRIDDRSIFRFRSRLNLVCPQRVRRTRG